MLNTVQLLLIRFLVVLITSPSPQDCYCLGSWYCHKIVAAFEARWPYHGHLHTYRASLLGITPSVRDWISTGGILELPEDVFEFQSQIGDCWPSQWPCSLTTPFLPYYTTAAHHAAWLLQMQSILLLYSMQNLSFKWCEFSESLVTQFSLKSHEHVQRALMESSAYHCTVGEMMSSAKGFLNKMQSPEQSCTWL